MRILVAGIGNIFMGDDAFGCEVVRRLADHDLPAGVDVADFGIRGIDLGYALTDGYDAAILVDTARRDGIPGTLYVIEPGVETPAADDAAHAIAPHEMDPVKVLRFAASLGALPETVLLVACEPESLGGPDGHIGLGSAVTGATDGAVTEILTLVDRLAARAGSGQPRQRRVTA